MIYTVYDLALLLLAYSFLAWIAETTVATVREKDFRNRGFAFGPFCFVYGVTAVLLTVFLQELRNDVFFLFLGSTVIATAAEWITGKVLERVKQKKWWDYSGKRWNFNGYICLQYSLLWGLLGVLAVRYVNGFLLGVYHLLPEMIGHAVIWVLAVIGLIDFLGSLLSVCHMQDRLPRLLRWNKRLQELTYGLAAKLSEQIERRIGRSYPATAQETVQESAQDTEKCSAAEVLWLFVLGAFLGDIVETIFCRLTAGVWMSRSSLVWGPFSVVWGLAIALATLLLYKDRDKQEHYIFGIGVLLGGAYEYICSVFTELVFGKVFWDYSAMPFNLGGRINLLYCLFWGVAAVVWMKGVYPAAAKLIGLILKKTGRVLTGILVVFMAANIVVSMMALVRYDTRGNGQEAVEDWEKLMDEHFGDARMERIYPNAK